MSNQTTDEGGFQALLANINLHSILQIEALSRSTGVFSVSSYKGSGALHLKDGELVHAETANVVGDDAALEILSWESGRIESTKKRIHSTKTVELPLQLLLMRSAQDMADSRSVAQEYEVDSEKYAVDVTLDPRGFVVSSVGDHDDNFAIQVALIDLFGTQIGKYVESGIPRSIDVCTTSGHTQISKTPDGLVKGKFNPIPKMESP